MLRNDDVQLSKNFRSVEFMCPCCDTWLDTPRFRAFLVQLQTAREIANIPFVITSGYRCVNHNKAIKGGVDSEHLVGAAADIEIMGMRQRFETLHGLWQAGFMRCGIGNGFIHVDNSIQKIQRVVWLYGR